MSSTKQDREEKQNPMERLAAFIVDKRKAFYLLYIGLAIFCVFSRGWVSVAADLTAYLPAEREPRQGLTATDEGFVPAQRNWRTSWRPWRA